MLLALLVLWRRFPRVEDTIGPGCELSVGDGRATGDGGIGHDEVDTAGGIGNVREPQLRAQHRQRHALGDTLASHGDRSEKRDARAGGEVSVHVTQSIGARPVASRRP